MDDLSKAISTMDSATVSFGNDTLFYSFAFSLMISYYDTSHTHTMENLLICS